MTTYTDAILQYVESRIATYERMLVEGKVPAPNADTRAGWANYRAAVQTRRDLYRIKAAIEALTVADEDTLDDLVTELSKQTFEEITEGAKERKKKT